MSAAETSKAFDAYEVIGVITPGTVVALLLALEWPELRALLGDDSLSVGDFGLFLVMAFVLGHLVQVLGNLIEEAIAATIGMPTTWVRKADQSLVSDGQRAALIAKLEAMEGHTVDPAKTKRKPWRNMMMRGYSRVRAVQRSSRIDAFNRTYGLFRGLSAAFIAAAAWYAYAYPELRNHVIVLGVLAAGSLWRMQRASINYAKSLIHEFIDL